ncbi:MAG: threonylcarbamoyl-AMP synthase [Desulfovibrio sp.]|jgi:L-threonylcarbamoyladenylate synthase|nr:threonylcarbamoyl-AMP synthase [Desulfovibrio sp.]
MDCGRSLTLAEAADAVRRGKAVLFPTESVFGLGCGITDAGAVAAIFSLKKRPPDKALPVIIGGRGQLGLAAAHVSPHALRLADAFWPGPLAVLFDARPDLPPLLTAGSGRVAVRVPAHPAARDLCLACGLPLVATSANISFMPATADPKELAPELLRGTAGIYCAGPAPSGGPPSTIVDLAADGTLHVLRAGAVTEARLKEAGFVVVAPAANFRCPDSGPNSGKS